MANYIKHVGVFSQYGESVIILYNYAIPGTKFGDKTVDFEHCYLLDPKKLHTMYEQELMSVVESPVAQAANHVGDVLARNIFSNGYNMLDWIIANKKFIKARVSDVQCVIRGYDPIPLQLVVDNLKKIEKFGDTYNPKKEMEVPSEIVKEAVEIIDGETNAPESVGEDSRKAMAQSKIMQIKLMQEDIKHLMAEAEQMSPGILEENGLKESNTKKSKGKK